MSESKTKTFQVRVNMSLVALVLLLTNIGTLLVWQPWKDTGPALETLSIVGESVLEVEPDQFVFNVSYMVEAESSETATQLAIAKSESVVDGLRDLGLEDSAIETSLSTYGDYPYYVGEDTDNGYTAYFSVAVNTKDKDMAQDVQDYLVSTSPEGSVTPYPSLSREKQKELTAQASNLAIDDATAKAQQRAEKLGLKIDRVVSYSENKDQEIYPYLYGLGDVAISSLDEEFDSARSLEILPGTEDFTYSVTVEFSLK